MAKNKNKKNPPAPQAAKKAETQAKSAEVLKEAAAEAVTSEAIVSNEDEQQHAGKTSKNSSKKKSVRKSMCFLKRLSPWVSPLLSRSSSIKRAKRPAKGFLTSSATA